MTWGEINFPEQYSGSRVIYSAAQLALLNWEPVGFSRFFEKPTS
jgi:hypothetical protein